MRAAPLSEEEMDSILKAIWIDDVVSVERQLDGFNIWVPDLWLDWDEDCKLPRLCYAHGAWKCFEWAVQRWVEEDGDGEESEDAIAFGQELSEMLGVMLTRAEIGDINADTVGEIVFIRGGRLDDEDWNRTIRPISKNPAIIRAETMRLSKKEREAISGICG